MADAKIIDGKALAQDLRAQVARSVAELKQRHGLTPGIAVVLVGEDPASRIYVRNKAKQAVAAGMASFVHKLGADTTQADLLALIDRLNADKQVHGILVQLPLPDQIAADAVIQAIDPAKDVDGFHAINTGKLIIGLPALAPCTPVGCVMLAKHALGELSGAHAVVVGRSNIVGKPLAQLLLRENCTLTICHSRTRDLAAVTALGDILIAAAGQPEMVKGGWIKPGACVIDVGINRVEDAAGNTKLVGDVDFAQALKVAGSITPVPGGVGPMTIACLLRNTLRAARAIAGLEQEQ
ncbi:MAG: bifunctional methylenetetrahydrofolate dehydrogenase/methenyltetrahydrofolate cyclohydrolase FolD [Proteobacteria bacterium]|nr:bifunctional methylenetetrahydrofolate dehydrogenase/methenyltetrahydrofolate cyclohydrolase FolD [Pseudomonadota bacterium]